MTPNKKSFIVSFLIFLGMLSHAGGQNLGPFNANKDIGEVKKQGSVDYNDRSQIFTIEGGGANMWGSSDQFHFLYKKLKGDFILRARVEFSGDGAHQHRKLGWNVRNSLSSKSAHVNAAFHGGDGLTSLQYRKRKGAQTEEKKLDVTYPDIIQLERRGDQFIMSAAKYGKPFKTISTSEVKLNNDVYIGLYVCSHKENMLEKAEFRNVRITQPADDDFTPYEDYIGSRLEIMDVESGHRRVIHTEDHSIQAPNWTVDGRSLIYNSKGLLFNFELTTHKPKQINTGFATNNNNDHVLSFSGERIGISHHSEEDNGESVIYTMPVEGGTPKQVTKKSPSYLHGWSPGDDSLVYTGQRNGQFDIYKISVNGGEEKQLTNTPTLDDGSEYTPDGKYIYFNSARTGTMQIWRMKPDGSQQEQVTHDNYNDWFPHVSPDGKRIVFLSYMPEVEAGDHPWYKHVYIRMMPLKGGEPQIISYVYGGQGTINVPSWSPNGEYISFISNTK